MAQLIETVDEKAQEAEQMDSETRQLNKSVNEIASTVTDVSAKTELMVGQARKSEELVDSSLTGFLSTIEQFQASKSNFDALIEEMDSISSVIELIKGIADETNLLALNASI